MAELIPADLIEAVESRAGDRALAELPAILAALSEHYPPGTLIDPATWERVTVEADPDAATRYVVTREDPT